MFNIDNVYKIPNFLSEGEIKAFDHFCSHYVWELEGFSHTDDKMFWKKDMWESKWGKCKDIESTFKIKIESLLGIKVETERLYLNGQAHGQCGSMHTDVIEETITDDKYITAVYYVNKQWSPEYGGFTVIIDRQDNMHVVYPQPNSIVIFDSRFAHVGLEPTMHCKDQRVTLAHKMKIIGQ
jgi:Rps23 Pro-64 3,4-dihydroxylase Tpa1-like proline 4-hydroxylase